MHFLRSTATLLCVGSCQVLAMWNNRNDYNSMQPRYANNNGYGGQNNYVGNGDQSNYGGQQGNQAGYGGPANSNGNSSNQPNIGGQNNQAAQNGPNNYNSGPGQQNYGGQNNYDGQNNRGNYGGQSNYNSGYNQQNYGGGYNRYNGPPPRSQEVNVLDYLGIRSVLPLYKSMFKELALWNNGIPDLAPPSDAPTNDGELYGTYNNGYNNGWNGFGGGGLTGIGQGVPGFGGGGYSGVFGRRRRR